MKADATSTGATEPAGREAGSESYGLDQLTWREVEHILARDSRLVIPVGSLEQHGPHLPLGTNTFIAERVATDLCQEHRVLRAPTIPYGVGLPATQPFAGTTTLRRKTFHRAVNELLAGWEDDGFHEFILITAHRFEPHLDALLMALTTESLTLVVDLYAIDVSDIVDVSPETEYAGEVETSLMLHLAPERVRRDQIADFVPDAGTLRRYVRGRVPTPPPDSQGNTGRPSQATPQKGKRIYERYLDGVRRAVAAASRR